MQTTAMAQQAYAQPSRATQTDRDVEYHAFAYVTGLMSAAKETAAMPGGLGKLADAMFQNLRLWLALAADVAEEANKLPNQTRAQIIGLANFMRNHMDRVISGDAEIDPLIDINLSIMKGLRGDDQEGGTP